MASAGTNRQAPEPPLAPEPLSAPDGTASTWRASGIGTQPGHENGAGGRRHELTAQELNKTYPATYQKVLDLLDEAHLNPDLMPAAVLEALVPILTDDRLKKSGRPRR